MITPYIGADGVECYVAYVNPKTEIDIRAIDARLDAYEAALFSGKNWRRAKREGRKAEKSYRAARRAKLN